MNHHKILSLIDQYVRELSGKDLAAFANLLDREAHRVRCLANAENLRKPGQGPFSERGDAKMNPKA